MDRTDIMLLAIASGLITVLLAYSLGNPGFSRELTKELCEDSDGIWNECGSLCTGEPPGTMCTTVCVPMCECQGNLQCPPGFYCRVSGLSEKEKGICSPILGRECEFDSDCPQARCLGAHSICQDGECRTVNELGALTRCAN